MKDQLIHMLGGITKEEHTRSLAAIEKLDKMSLKSAVTGAIMDAENAFFRKVIDLNKRGRKSCYVGYDGTYSIKIKKL